MKVGLFHGTRSCNGDSKSNSHSSHKCKHGNSHKWHPRPHLALRAWITNRPTRKCKRTSKPHRTVTQATLVTVLNKPATLGRVVGISNPNPTTSQRCLVINRSILDRFDVTA